MTTRSRSAPRRDRRSASGGRRKPVVTFHPFEPDPPARRSRPIHAQPLRPQAQAQARLLCELDDEIAPEWGLRLNPPRDRLTIRWVGALHLIAALAMFLSILAMRHQSALLIKLSLTLYGLWVCASAAKLIFVRDRRVTEMDILLLVAFTVGAFWALGVSLMLT